MEIQWLGHAAFRIATAGKTILVDPWFEGNPSFPADAAKTIGKVDIIAVTHGHQDHLGDTARLAGEHGSQVVAMVEVCTMLDGHGVGNLNGMNLGGTVTLGEVSLSMVNALHSSSIGIEGGGIAYLGVSAGFVIRAGDKAVYHAGDTDVFSDMALIQRQYRPQVGLLPIGGHFTMGPEAAALACNEFLELEVVVPMHYGTFPVLIDNADGFKALVQRGRVEILEPGGAITV